MQSLTAYTSMTIAYIRMYWYDYSIHTHVLVMSSLIASACCHKCLLTLIDISINESAAALSSDMMCQPTWQRNAVIRL